MKIDASELARLLGREVRLPFQGRAIADGAIALTPEGHPNSSTFDLVVTVRWRSIEIRFEQGAFSGDLVSEMGRADEDARAAFVSVLQCCASEDAVVTVSVNGDACHLTTPPWSAPWKTLSISIKKGQLLVGVGSEAEDTALLMKWTVRAAAAVMALLPLDRSDETSDPGALGLPEGAKSRVEVNRYERDRRNRTAALAIHGFACHACGILLAGIYGEAAADFIEVHHVVPLSELGPNYRINPQTDLVPLCSNCHGVAHRRTPPYSVSEIREMILRTRMQAADSRPPV